MLKEYRLNHNLTQEEMAKLLNVSVASYCLYENHKREMSFGTLTKFLELRNDEYDKVLIEVIQNFKKVI